MVFHMSLRSIFATAALALASCSTSSTPSVPDLPANQVDVFLLCGQSNMQGVGRAELIPESERTVAGVHLFHSRSVGSGETALQWVPLRPAGWAGAKEEMYGVELTLAARLMESRDGREMYFVKHAVGGTNVHTDWKPETGPEWKTMQSVTGRALAELEARGHDPIVRGIFWQQGESDARSVDTADAYGENMVGFIAALRASVAEHAAGGDPDSIKFVMGQVIPDDTPGSMAAKVYPGRVAVRAAQLALARDVTNVATVPTDPSFETHASDGDDYRVEDNIHFNGPGIQKLGRAMAEAYVARTSPTD